MDSRKKFFSLSFIVFAATLGAIENYGAYIPPMCYTKTKQNAHMTNPCYVCHTNGEEPNYFNELHLQKAYLFPKKMMHNPYKNLFIDRRSQIASLSTQNILAYIRTNNYDAALQKKFGCYFNFDDEGFDRDENGTFTLWRAFTYRPFMGTFFPTNGSMDDVIIKLPKIFAQDKQGNFDLQIYKKNLDALVDALQGDAKKVYVEKAASIQINKGLFPVGTEFLHTVRYIDFVNNKASGSKRLKELRYAKKEVAMTYAELERLANKEFFEELDAEGLPAMQSYRGDAKAGFDNAMGWRYKGYIEAKNGQLRLQNDEETLSCMGCHSLLGVTTDSTFAMKRYVKWGYQNLEGLGDTNGEYAKYLLQNPTGNEYGTNDEVYQKFFDAKGNVKHEPFMELSKDIRTLLLPSYARAMELNKAYYFLVQEQNFIQGKEATKEPIKNVHKSIESINTFIENIIINNYDKDNL